MVGEALRAVVTDLWGRRWSPEQVAHQLRVQFPDQRRRQLCSELNYQAIYDPAVTRPAVRRGRLTSMTMIADRPLVVAERVEPGHWEGDCAMGAGNGSANRLAKRAALGCGPVVRGEQLAQERGPLVAQHDRRVKVGGIDLAQELPAAPAWRQDV